MLTVDVVEDLSSLLEDHLSWDRLSRGVPFRQAAWLGPWWNCLGKECQATVLIARDEQGELIGAMPLYRKSGSRTLRGLGDGAACTDHVSVLASTDRCEEIALAFGRHLASICSDDRHGWDLIDIDGVVEGDQAMAAFATGLRECGSQSHAGSRMSTWFKAVEEDWQQHIKHHGKTQRRRMRRWCEKIDDDPDVDRMVAVTESEVKELLDVIIDLHQKRWEADGEPGSYADPNFRDFMHQTCQQFMLQGQLHLAGLRLKGKVIAGEINFIGENRIMYCYSSGYDIEFAQLEPGRLLLIDSLRDMYRLSLAGADFMRGDESYKSRFTNQSRKLYRVRVVAPTLFPRLRHAVWTTGFEVKQWMRRRTGRPEILVNDATEIG
jgi:CelD/BcsL family acetyltransferase involved in cellulose biosynthesis